MTSYIDACYEHKDKQFQINSGIAVAANQMGLCDQIIYVHFNQDGLEHKYLIANPKIIAESMQKCVISQGEGCLSVPCDQKGYVKRANKIIVKAFDLLNEFKPIQITAEGILAVCLQHEIDHLQGMLYYDRIDSKNPYYLQPD